MSIDQEHKRDWRDYLPEGRERVESARATWDPSGRIRCEDPASKGDEGKPGDDGDGKAGAKPKAEELTPAARAAIAKATQDAVAAARSEWEKETEGLKAKNEELLGKLKKREGDLEKLGHERDAGKIGAKPEEFTAAVEEAAQRKNEAFRREQSELIKAKDDKLAELETTIAKLNRQVHRSFIAQEIARASIPPELRMIHDGAEHQLIDRLEEAIVPVKIEGLPHPVARIKVGGVFQPTLGASNTPDGLMEMGELLDLMRAGKGPIPDAGWYFRSTARGSGTVDPGSTNGSAAGGDWRKMTPAQRAAYTRDHGVAAAKLLMEKSAAKSAAAT